MSLLVEMLYLFKETSIFKYIHIHFWRCLNASFTHLQSTIATRDNSNNKRNYNIFAILLLLCAKSRTQIGSYLQI